MLRFAAYKRLGYDPNLILSAFFQKQKIAELLKLQAMDL